MYRHRSLLPLLRCSHSQSRLVADAASLKRYDRASSNPERPAAPKPFHVGNNPRVTSTAHLRQRKPSAKSWTRSEDMNSRPHTFERQTPQNFFTRPNQPQAKWSPSSLQLKSHPNSQNKGQRPTTKREFQPFSKNALPASTSWPIVKENVVTQEQKENNINTEKQEIELSDQWDPELDDVPEDDGVRLRDHSWTNRSRSVQYKTRGSVVEKLHHIQEQDHGRKTAHNNPTQKQKSQLPRMKPKPRMSVYIPSVVTVGTLARILEVKLNYLRRKMVEAGMSEESSHDHVLTSDYAVLLAEELGYNPVVDDEAAFDLYPPAVCPELSTLPSRPPIVTIMGHVDHGKTTLLDTLRSSAVAKGEAGGITQHIGAFSVPVNSSQGKQSITFLDTPGHAAFSAMRARGAGITDLVVLVVAADDGIMPQTKEVINLLKKDTGKVGLVVAINKVDKPEANVEAVKLSLMAEGIQLECFGGDIPSVEVSGLTGQGLPDLVEVLSAMAELQELRAEREGVVHGYVLESRVTKGLGSVATVLILRGCLKSGSHLLSGTNHAKVRVMTDSSGKTVKAAYPGMAVTVSGWKSLPKAGDEVLDGKESDVKKALANRVRKAEIAASLADVDAINATRREERERRQTGVLDTRNMPTSTPTELNGPKELRLIIKADVSGSAEAVEGALEGIGNKKAMVRIVSSNVGDVTESDVLMAKAIEATIVAFSVSVPRSAEILAVQNSVPIATSPIIYRLMEDVRQRVAALLPTIKETKVTGEASVIQMFDIQLKAKKVKKIAGCRVVNGMVERADNVRIVRDGSVIHEGSLDTMRIHKKDVTEVRKGLECGLSFLDFEDLREGDLIQMYQTIEKPGVL